MVNKLYYFDLFFLLFLGFVYTHFYDAKIIKNARKPSKSSKKFINLKGQRNYHYFHFAK